MAARFFIAYLFLLVGCSSTPAAPASDSLASRVGHEVELHGQLRAPGKIAEFYLETGDGMVVLTGNNPSLRKYANSNDKIFVRGILQQYVAPKHSGVPDHYAQLPDYYFIDSAQLVAP